MERKFNIGDKVIVSRGMTEWFGDILSVDCVFGVYRYRVDIHGKCEIGVPQEYIRKAPKFNKYGFVYIPSEGKECTITKVEYSTEADAYFYTVKENESCDGVYQENMLIMFEREHVKKDEVEEMKKEKCNDSIVSALYAWGEAIRTMEDKEMEEINYTKWININNTVVVELGDIEKLNRRGKVLFVHVRSYPSDSPEIFMVSFESVDDCIVEFARIMKYLPMIDEKEEK